MGCAGNRIVWTPHIDSLAEAGSWFPRFHVASSTCMSNRATEDYGWEFRQRWAQGAARASGG